MIERLESIEEKYNEITKELTVEQPTEEKCNCENCEWN